MFSQPMQSNPSRSSIASEDARFPWSRSDIINVALLFLVTSLAVRTMWGFGIPNKNDMLMSVYRVYELDRAWSEGMLYPRLGPSLYFGYGAPLFQYYHPLASYVALSFLKIGLGGYIIASKATVTLSFFLAGLGAYIYARWLFRSRLAALLSAMLYLMSPYLLVVMYERGAIAEGLALALLPWLFWGIHRLTVAKGFAAIVLASVIVALVIFAHNITALFALPAAALFTVILAMVERRWDYIPRMLLALALGFGLSAFYWVPALGELYASHTSNNLLSGPVDVGGHLVELNELVQDTWLVRYDGPQRFRFGSWYFVLGAVSLLAIPFQVRRRNFIIVLLITCCVVILALQLEDARVFWYNVPLVRFIQLPWRLFGLASLAIALAVGSFIAFLESTRYRMIPGFIVGTLMVLTALSSLSYIFPAHLSGWMNISEAGINASDLFQRGRDDYPLFSDYKPIGLQIPGYALSNPRGPRIDIFAPMATQPELQVLRESWADMRLQVNAESSFTFRFSRVFFPGWQVSMGGSPVPTFASGPAGFVTAEMPAGQYQMRVHFGQTPLRRVADWISLLTLLLCLAGLIFFQRRRRLLLTGIIVVMVVGIAIVGYRVKASAAVEPTAYHANLGEELTLLGYHMPDATWDAGSEIPVRLYWLANRTPYSDYTVFFHVVELDDSGRVAQFDQQPALGYGPMTRWDSGEVATTEFQLALDKETKPGRYWLVMGVYAPETLRNLPVEGASHVLPGDRIVLAEIEVRGE